jgi:hypothetical protein
VKVQRANTHVAVAFSHTGEVISWRLPLSRPVAERLQNALVHLLNLGHVANFSIQNAADSTWSELLEDLGGRCGSGVLSACIDPPVRPSLTAPAFLMPVWAFDHEVHGSPAATAQLLGIYLELIATRSADEEHGAYLPGRNGLWLIHARPMF